jgi:methyl-accepting chemotaxis protein
VLVLVTANVEVFLLRPLRGLKQAMQDLAGNTLTDPPPATGPGELRELAAGLKQLRDRMHEYDVKLARESSRRQEMEPACASSRSATR